MALDPLLDVSRGASHLSYTYLKRVKKLLQEHQLVDVWRLMTGGERDYSFFSPAHQSYSRLDYFFLRHTDLPLVLGAKILPSTLSDHAPVRLALSTGTRFQSLEMEIK